MKKNIGFTDKVVRWVIGLSLLSIIFWVHSPWRWIGLIGFIPLIIGSVGYCPIYSIFGISTACKSKPEPEQEKEKK